MKFRGEAQVSWTEQESRRSDNGETENYSVKYDAEEEYFENKMTLVGGGGILKWFAYNTYLVFFLHCLFIFIIFKENQN